MIEITDANLQSEILDANTLALLDFSAVWCQPCKKLEPILKELAPSYEGKAIIGHCDVAKSPDTAKRFSIMAVPTVVFVKGGKEVDRFTGLQSREQIVKRIESHL
jgi:thioredoxin 1